MLGFIFTVFVVSQVGQELAPSDLGKNEVFVSAISSSEISNKVIPIANWGCESSPAGVCDGINWFNYLNLRGRIRFKKDPRIAPDSTASILVKLRAARNSPEAAITIYGYGSSQQFFDAMKKLKFDDANPLKFIIENLHADRKSGKDLIEAFERTPEQNELVNVLTINSGARRYRGKLNALHQIQARSLAHSIDQRTPVRLAVFGVNLNWGHAVTVVGYKRDSSSKAVTAFYLLDPLFPRKLQKLELKKGSDGKTYWHSPSLGIGRPEDFKRKTPVVAEVVIMRPSAYEVDVWQQREPNAKDIVQMVTSVGEPLQCEPGNNGILR